MFLQRAGDSLGCRIGKTDNCGGLELPCGQQSLHDCIRLGDGLLIGFDRLINEPPFAVMHALPDRPLLGPLLDDMVKWLGVEAIDVAMPPENKGDRPDNE